MEETPLRCRNSERTSGNIPKKSLTTPLARLARLQKKNSFLVNTTSFSDNDVTSTPMMKLKDVKMESHTLLVSPISHVEENSIGDFDMCGTSLLEDLENESVEQINDQKQQKQQQQTAFRRLWPVQDITNIWRQEEEESLSDDKSGEAATVDSGYMTKETMSELSASLPVKRKAGSLETTGNQTESNFTVSYAHGVSIDASRAEMVDYTMPLQISIPSPKKNTDQPSPREKMFLALDRDFHRYLRWFRKDRFEIGRYTGQSQVDIVSALDEYDTSGFILSTYFLPFLLPCELRRMRLVCKRWRDVVTRRGRDRWRPRRPPWNPFLGKENQRSEASFCCSVCSPSSSAASLPPATPDPSCSPLCTPDSAGGFVRRGPMLRTQPVGESPLAALVLSPEARAGSGERPDTWHRFVLATSSLLSSEHLGRCPSCGGPSRIHPATRRAVCTEKTCGLDYCNFCLYPYHENRPCRRKISPTKEEAIRNSPEKRQTKRRLKRL